MFSAALRFLTLLVTAAAVRPAACGAEPPVRESWTNSRLTGSPEKPPELVAVPAYPKLPVKRPEWVDRDTGSDLMLVL